MSILENMKMECKTWDNDIVLKIYGIFVYLINICNIKENKRLDYNSRKKISYI